MNIKHWSLPLFTLLALSGCTIPGGHIDTFDSQYINEDQKAFELDSSIHIYRMTPELVRSLAPAAVPSRGNPSLDEEINLYEYHIGQGDILNVTIWEHPELTIPAGSFRSAADAGNWVHSDGNIFYPYVGRIPVQGKTVLDVRDDITHKLATYIEKPQVDVNVALFRSQRAYITGEVKRPGKQSITNIPLTLLDAINSAGGLSANADWENVYLTHNGSKEKLSIKALLQHGDLTQNRVLKSGDILHIPRNDDLKVFVMGEVNTPATLQIDRSGMTLAEALSSSQGIMEGSANASGVFVLRSQINEQHEQSANVYQLDMSNSVALVMASEFHLNPYDVVYVTAAPISRWNRLMKQIVPTLNGLQELSQSATQLDNLGN